MGSWIFQGRFEAFQGRFKGCSWSFQRGFYVEPQEGVPRDLIGISNRLQVIQWRYNGIMEVSGAEVQAF